ncbi:MAG: amino acid adenylation domain-containing protein [Gammaproteobacteria bacterium]|nr:amino acid adenylation domain-containing protein [Gammaproteobacteria bacterium]
MQMTRNKVNLSLSQERLCFLDQVLPEKAVFNITCALRILGELSLHCLNNAFNDVINRHDILRLKISQVDGGYTGELTPASSLEIKLSDYSLGRSERTKVNEYIKRISKKQFDLIKDHLIRAELITLNDAEYILVVTMHHIVSDEWSLDVFFRDLSAYYRSQLMQIKTDLPTLEFQYFDYAGLQRVSSMHNTASSEMLYWLDHLNQAPHFLSIPTDKNRPHELSYEGSSLKTLISPSISRSILKYCQSKRLTLFTFLITVFQILLHRISGEDDIVIGYPSANRENPEVENLIGFFVNILPLRSTLNENKTFNTFITETKNNLLRGYEHQGVHFDQLVSKLSISRNQNYHPIFQTLFTLQTRYADILDFGDLETSFIEMGDEFAKFDLSLACLETAEGISIKMNYSLDLFNESTVKIIMECYEHLLNQCANNTDNTPITCMTLYSEFNNDNNLDLSLIENAKNSARIHEIFEEVAQTSPDNIAIVVSEKSYSFQEINQLANQFANYLQKMGLVAGDYIALSLDPSIELIVCILGILKISGVYLPLDGHYPPKRMSIILNDSRAKAIIFSSSEQQLLLENHCIKINLQMCWAEIILNNKVHISKNVDQDKACIIYTSGSTGLPKGVICRHSSIINRTQWFWKSFPITPNEKCILLANMAFVDAVGEIFSPLLNGVTLIIPPAKTAANPELLISFLIKYTVTRICMVPSLLSVLLENYSNIGELLPNLIHWEISGEAFPQALMREAMNKLRNKILINRYGSTEATSVIYNQITYNSSKNIHVQSKIIDNTYIFILDKNLVPVPKGLVGNLYIAGAPLAQGYLNNPELTKEKFLINHKIPGVIGRIYKTGDLAKICEEGNITVLGRDDRQIKINGFRVDLEEVESLLESHSNIKKCVICIKSQEKGLKSLIAYLSVINSGIANQSKINDEMQKYLESRIPQYMIPASFVIVNHFPYLPNGKLDHKALENIVDHSNMRLNSYNAPRNLIEYRLTKIWEKILNRQKIGVLDDFFKVGGNSLVAIRLIAKIQQEFKIKYPVANIYKHPTIASSAEIIGDYSESQSLDVLLPIETTGTYTPIFLIHTAFGLSYPYVPLSYCLKNQPIYAINDPGLNDSLKAFSSIQDMAGAYIEIIQSVQKRGPYILGGWSFGGMVALEMARQLKAQNQDIKVVFLFDSTNYPKEIIRDLTDEELDEVFRDLDIDKHSSEASMLIQENKRCLELLKKHSPSEYNGRVILVKAQDDEFTIPFRAEDVFQGWGQLIGRQLEIYSIPGLHHQLFENRYIDGIVGVLQDILYKIPEKTCLQDSTLDILDAYLHFSIEKNDMFLVKRFINLGSNLQSIDSACITAIEKIKKHNSTKTLQEIMGNEVF